MKSPTKNEQELLDKIESIEKNNTPVNLDSRFKEIETYLESIEKMYEATMEIFVLKDIQSMTFFNQLKGEINQIHTVIQVMSNKLMTEYPEYEPVKIPFKYNKYKPPKTTNKVLKKFLRKSTKKLKKWMQEKNKHYGKHNQPTK